jgi:Protein of unknown function (DUF2442)
MLQDAVLVKPLADYQLYVELVNGQKGVFDVAPFLMKGALKELLDETYFMQVSIAFGAVSWPNGQDIAPQTLANGLKTMPADTTLSIGN